MVNVIDKKKADALYKKVSIILGHLSTGSPLYRFPGVDEFKIDFREKPVVLLPKWPLT
jgi:hypothetical protein